MSRHTLNRDDLIKRLQKAVEMDIEMDHRLLMDCLAFLVAERAETLPRSARFNELWRKAFG